MQYNFLGTTSMKVSRICLGTMTWGHRNTEAEAHRQIDMARDYGINFMDTAELYAVPPSEKTYGKTEEHIGSYFAKHSHRRKDWIIATKIAGPSMQYIRGGEGFTPKGIARAVRKSLERLKVERIDLYQLHWPQRRTPRFGVRDFNASWFAHADALEETLGALGKCKTEGLIGEIGVSNENSWGLMHCLRLNERNMNIPRVQTIQNVYNLVSRTADAELVEVVVRERVGFLAYSPLAGGLLTGKYQNGALPEKARFSTWGKDRMTRYVNSNTDTAIDRYCALARKYGLSPLQLAMGFVNGRDFVASNIIGATSEGQLRECIEANKIELSSQILREMESIHYELYNPSA